MGVTLVFRVTEEFAMPGWRAMSAVKAIAAGIAITPALFGGVHANAQERVQGRVIEENLVVTDPTVAAPQHWLVGGAVEGWFSGTPWEPVWDIHGNQVGTESFGYGQLGGNVTVGYDDFWAMLSYRTGSGQQTTKFSEGLNERSFPQESELEFKLRYLLRDVEIFGTTPYLLAGYNDSKLDSPLTILNPGTYFIVTGTPLLQRSIDFSQGFVGGGGIHPFNDRFGVRADLVLSGASVVLTESNVLPGLANRFTSPGIGGRAHATLYYKLTDNLVASFGATAVGVADRVYFYDYVGVYTNLGYNIRF
ncbi:MAG: hypothetical protein ACLPKB_09795 [Xanthobacteraceae bacterium]